MCCFGFSLAFASLGFCFGFVFGIWACFAASSVVFRGFSWCFVAAVFDSALAVFPPLQAATEDALAKVAKAQAEKQAIGG